VNRRLPAFSLLLLLIFRISLGWAGMPGVCHHSHVAHPHEIQQAQTAASAQGETGMPCHHGEESAPSSQGRAPHTSVDCGCHCGCCHLVMALPSLGLPELPTAHDAVAELNPATYDSHIPPPLHRPPITLSL
jgi:hypothetical protein